MVTTALSMYIGLADATAHKFLGMQAVSGASYRISPQVKRDIVSLMGLSFHPEECHFIVRKRPEYTIAALVTSPDYNE